MKAVFLDRDGTINRKPREGKYVTSWREFKLLPNVDKAIRHLNEAGFLVIVVTNQRGVAIGYMTEDRLREIHRQMVDKLSSMGARIDAVYYCPHEERLCSCRKPETGLFRQAKADYPEIDFANSYVIGDSPKDIEAGKRIGCTTIMIVSAQRGTKGSRPPITGLTAISLYEAVNEHVIPERNS